MLAADERPNLVALNALRLDSTKGAILVLGTRATKVHEELGHRVLRRSRDSDGSTNGVAFNETTDYCGTSP